MSIFEPPLTLARISAGKFSAPLMSNMRPDDRNRILHMIEAAEAVREFVAGRTAADLDQDRMLLFALLRAVEILGEAASKISPETRAANVVVPWRQIIATRNRLIHGYFDIDSKIVWKTATEEIPNLLTQLQFLLRRS